jgi:hypothetical protein
MKTGDYIIHVYVQEGKMFKVEGSDTCNPFVEISSCNKTKYTSNRKDVPCNSKSLISWREHLFIEPKAMVSFVFDFIFELRIQATSKTKQL